MTARWLLGLSPVGALTIGVGLPVTTLIAFQQQAPPPTFRSSASGVAVDVSVLDRGRRPITNLKPEDFEILDNGVLQTVDNLSYGKVPIDVTVGLDVSFSVSGVTLERLRRGVIQLMRDLGPQDRLRLMLFNMRVNRTVDFTTDPRAIEAAMKTLVGSGSTALMDAISVSLVSSSAADRRQLVVFFTDGSDSSSVTSASALTTVARRARATLAFVMPSQMTTMTTGTGRSGTTTIRIPGTQTPAIYTTLARETGGSVLPVGATTDLSATFQRILNEFRSTYVVYFNARGVEPGGYHTLDVKVKRENAVVQARRGYWY